MVPSRARLYWKNGERKGLSTEISALVPTALIMLAGRHRSEDIIDFKGRIRVPRETGAHGVFSEHDTICVPLALNRPIPSPGCCQWTWERMKVVWVHDGCGGRIHLLCRVASFPCPSVPLSLFYLFILPHLSQESTQQSSPDSWI